MVEHGPESLSLSVPFLRPSHLRGRNTCNKVGTLRIKMGTARFRIGLGSRQRVSSLFLQHYYSNHQYLTPLDLRPYRLVVSIFQELFHPLQTLKPSNDYSNDVRVMPKTLLVTPSILDDCLHSAQLHFYERDTRVVKVQILKPSSN